MRYFIAVEEKRNKVVEIEANSESEALARAEEAYYDDEICLDEPEYIEDGTTSFTNETDDWEDLIKKGFKPRFQKL